jgi:hypothetical protein
MSYVPKHKIFLEKSCPPSFNKTFMIILVGLLDPNPSTILSTQTRIGHMFDPSTI